MYSKTFYWFIENTSWMACSIGSSCVYFDGKLNIFYVTTTARKRFQIVTGLMLIAWAYLVVKSVQLHLEGDKTHFALSYSLTLVASTLTVPLLTYCIDVNEYRYLLAEGLKFALNFQKKWMPKFNWKTSPTGPKFDIFLALSFITFDFIVPIFFVIVAIVLKDLPILPHMSLPKYLQNIWIYIPEYIFILYAATIYSHTIAFQVTALASYFVTLLPLIKQEFTANRKETQYRTLPSLREVDNLIKEYAVIDYLHRRSIKFYGKALIPTHTLLGQFILYCNFTLIRHRHKLDVLLNSYLAIATVSSFFFWVLLLEAAGRFHKDSVKCLASWKFIKSQNPLKLKLLRKYKKRFRPLVISAGEYFKIKRLHVLKFMRSIMTGTFRALLTIKQ